jgi:cobalamin biosynthesis Mg chelatase CobN
MRRRICLAVGLVALSIPASGWAQSSSQAQYQGVAPETQLPVTGTGGGSGTSGGAAVTSGGNQSGSNQATGGGRPLSGVGRGGNGSATNGAGSTDSQTKVALPDASSSTSPFSGGGILWIVVAIAGLTGLGLLLRRTTHRSPAV